MSAGSAGCRSAAGSEGSAKAAWINSAPHHAFGRALKVGKEEIMGMLAAVEMWVKRDQQAEWANGRILAERDQRSRVTTSRA